MNRRSFLAAAIAAPAIVRAEILMPVVKVWTPKGGEVIVYDLTLHRVIGYKPDSMLPPSDLWPYQKAFIEAIERRNTQR